VLPTRGEGYDLNAHYPDLLLAVDVVLDSYPYGGFFGAYTALSIGAPVVSLQAPLFCGLFTVPLAARVRLPELATTTPQAYVALAVRLGTDAAYRAEVRARLRVKAHTLWDKTAEADVVREWQAFFLRISGRDTTAAYGNAR
jgi:predicted O-linked N-acetylglucosamine transferase (SPINDLY family)